MSNIHSNDETKRNRTSTISKDIKQDRKNNSKKQYENTNNEPIIFKATNVSISTCTVLTNLNSKINLGLISRFIPVHEQYSTELDNKTGGIYNLEFYGNCARGETLIDKIKDEFNNQATIKFKYW